MLLPLAILVLVALTGWQAFHTTSAGRAPDPWAAIFAALTVLGLVGPLLALLVFRDSPDRFLLIASLLTVPLPLAVLAYGLRSPHPR